MYVRENAAESKNLFPEVKFHLQLVVHSEWCLIKPGEGSSGRTVERDSECFLVRDKKRSIAVTSVDTRLERRRTKYPGKVSEQKL